MTNWARALSDAWNDLRQISPVAREFRTKLISAELSVDIFAAMRAADNAPCLVLYAAPQPEAQFELGGMRLSTTLGDNDKLLVLSLEDSSRHDLFLTICADIAAAAAAAGKGDSRERLLARLDAWRQFLRDRRDGLSRSDTIGLIGELLVLERILEIDCHRLPCWQAPKDGLHDFVIDGHALEAKTSIGPAMTITISRLDQLDISGMRRLDLLHVRLVEAPEGRRLRDIISAVADKLPDDAARRSFENSLLRRGLMPDDDAARDRPLTQLRSIDAYSIVDTFPRLVRSLLPIAITEATYALDVRAIMPFVTDNAAVLKLFVRGERE
jgi:hypothetical protein